MPKKDIQQEIGKFSPQLCIYPIQLPSAGCLVVPRPWTGLLASISAPPASTSPRRNWSCPGSRRWTQRSRHPLPCWRETSLQNPHRWTQCNLQDSVDVQGRIFENVWMFPEDTLCVSCLQWEFLEKVHYRENKKYTTTQTYISIEWHKEQLTGIFCFN